MKVAFVTHSSGLYGANRSLLSLIDGLKAFNVKSHVVAPAEGLLTEELSNRRVPCYTVPFKGWMSRNRWRAPARLGLNIALLFLIGNRLRQWKVDLIHTNSSVTPIGAMLAEVLTLPHTWHIREFGKRDFGLSHDWGRSFFRSVVSRATATIAVSKAVRQHVVSDISAPCHVIYNGVVPLEKIERIRKQTKSSGGNLASRFTFAIVGKLSPAKGQSRALRALHHLKRKGESVHLLIAGDGPPEHVESLRRLCHSLNLSQEVTFLGYVTDPFEVYQRTDAVLMCSPHEAMGRVTAEAMAAARPVIGYDSDGTAELIDDEQNGLLYNGSIEHLALCMRRLVENRGWASSLGREGQEKAYREFTNEVYARRVYEVMRRAASTSKGR